jgi:hypothetical protein
MVLRKRGPLRVTSVGFTMLHGAVTRKVYRARGLRYTILDVFLSPMDVSWWSRHARLAETIRHWEYTSILDGGGAGMGIPAFIQTKGRFVCILNRVVPSFKEGQSSLVRGDALSLPFKDKSFDVVCSVAVLPQIPKELRPQFLSELKRVGKRVCIYSEAVQDETGNFRGLEWESEYNREVLGRNGAGSADDEALAKRRVDLAEITAFLPNYYGCQNYGVTYRYMSLASRPFMGFWARLRYLAQQGDDRLPPYKGVIATD